jgi:hypothetical protein
MVARIKMKSNNEWRIKPGQILLGAAFLLALVIVRGTRAGNEPIHLVTDWSHRHVIFSAPKNLGQHVQLLSNPRYVQQLLRRNAANAGIGDRWRWRRAPERGTPLQGDWSVLMGVGATVGALNFPAKYSFDPTSANCSNATQPDFVVYNTSVAGSTTSSPASQTITFGNVGGGAVPSGTVVITNGANTLTLTATAGVSSGTNFHVGSDTGLANREANAASLVAAIDLAGNGNSVGVSAADGGTDVVTITATTAGSAGNLITLGGTIKGSAGVSFGGGTFVGGTSPQATIGAIDNLYSSCPGFVSAPNNYWAYNTGNGRTIATSPVLSSDATQIAVIENGTGPTTASLVLIKWAANDGNFTTPTVATNSATAAAYNTCVPVTGTPCMFTIRFSNANGGLNALDTTSSPFYDYANDALYVGNSNGYLHKFTPVFNGAPAEVISTVGADLWPASVSPGNVLTSPVLDDVTGRVFVASSSITFYRVDSIIGSGAGGVVASGTLGAAGIDDSPILDSTTGNVYVFVRRDNGGGAAERAGVYQFTTGFASGTTGAESAVSSNSTLPATAFYAGDFDNIYYSSANGTGNMYVCGTNGGLPAIWRVPITAGALGTPVAGPTLASANVACSGITENLAGSTDRMFLSVTNNAITGTSGGGAAIDCPTPTGCIMYFDITTVTGWGVATGTAATAAEAGGTSGIVVDGSSSAGGASQIYFTPLANQTCTTSHATGGCAIQASQSELN